MRMLMWGGIVLLFVMGMEGCAGRPAPSVNSDAESAASSEQNTAPQKAMTGAEKNASSKSATSEGYDLSSEGEAPDTGDVEFEEDRLPAPPEEVSGEPLETTRVQAQQVEEMPAVSGDEGAKTRIEPSVTAPVEPSVQAPIASHPPVMSRGFRVQPWNCVTICGPMATTMHGWSRPRSWVRRRIPGLDERDGFAKLVHPRTRPESGVGMACYRFFGGGTLSRERGRDFTPR